MVEPWSEWEGLQWGPKIGNLKFIFFPLNSAVAPPCEEKEAQANQRQWGKCPVGDAGELYSRIGGILQLWGLNKVKRNKHKTALVLVHKKCLRSWEGHKRRSSGSITGRRFPNKFCGKVESLVLLFCFIFLFTLFFISVSWVWLRPGCFILFWKKTFKLRLLLLRCDRKFSLSVWETGGGGEEIEFLSVWMETVPWIRWKIFHTFFFTVPIAKETMAARRGRG